MTASNSGVPKPDAAAQGVSRRRFLQSTAAVAGAALPLYSTLAVSAAPKKIRMGVVGGGFGTSFQWHEHPDCVVEAVSDLRPERREGLMRVYKCGKSYNSLEELVLDKNIDAVAIFTEAPEPRQTCRRGA